MGKVHGGMAAGFHGVAVRQLRRGAVLLREARMWRYFALQHARRGAWTLADQCEERRGRLAAQAFELATDARVLGLAIGNANVSQAGDAMRRRAVAL